MRWVLAMLLVAIGLAIPRSADACMNATMHDSSAEAKLREGEQAEYEGDVITARKLSSDVLAAYAMLPSDLRPWFIMERATRIHALSFIRDPKASNAELNQAKEELRVIAETPTTAEDVALEADYGEALERTGHVDEAYELLLPLMHRDVIGSSYALAALGRAAHVKGDDLNGTTAASACRRTAPNPATCSAYPHQPFMRGRPIDFAFPGFVFLGAALIRVTRPRRPWSRFAAKPLAIAVVLSAVVIALPANVRQGALATGLAFTVVIAIGLAQQRLFFSAVRRGKVPAFSLRPSTDEDIGPPSTIGFFFGPAQPEILQPAGEGSYRDSARVAGVMRVVRRPIPTGLIVAFVGLMLLFAGCAATLTLTRG
jgi:hypothetical protein